MTLTAPQITDDEDLTLRGDYVLKVVEPDQADTLPTLSVEVVAALDAYFRSGNDRLPALDTDPWGDHGELTTDIDDFADANIVAGNCDIVSEHIQERLTWDIVQGRATGSALDHIVRVDVVQGLLRPTEEAKFHVAVLITLTGGGQFVYDLTYNQFQDPQQFPLVASASEWVAMLGAASEQVVAPLATIAEVEARIARVWPTATLRLAVTGEDGDRINIDYLEVPPGARRSGIARGILYLLASESDRMGWTLTASIIGRYTVPRIVLNKMLRWHGFVGTTSLVRTPRTAR